MKRAAGVGAGGSTEGVGKRGRSPGTSRVGALDLGE